MFDYISGKLVQKEPSRAIIDVNGIGYEIKIPLTTYSSIEENTHCKLYTHLQIREDAHVLYGFSQRSDRDTFLLLLSVSGIGSSTGLAILSSMKGEEIRQALAEGNEKAFLAIKGIGSKTSQRMILELKDKASKIIVSEGKPTPSVIVTDTNYDLALEALVQMGFAKPSAEKTIQEISKKYGKTLSAEEIIKIALKNR
ncbi:MAG: Holliday junction branch migration protein RuvA [Flammeovirgaceae bacterium]